MIIDEWSEVHTKVLVKKLLKDNEILREALSYYADVKNWSGPGVWESTIDNDDVDLLEPVSPRGGKRAREALEKVK